MGTPFGSEVEEEIKEGMALADASRAAGVGHLIYASGASADRHTGIPYSDSKYRVEQHIASLGVPYTISAPVFFMQNLVSPWVLPALRQGKLTMALPAARKLQQIAVGDIGEFVAALVDRREVVFGRRFDIAGDELSGEQMAAILSRVSGREIHYEGFPAEALRRRVRTPRLCGSGSTVSVLRSISKDCAATFRKYAGIGSRTGRARRTGALS